MRNIRRKPQNARDLKTGGIFQFMRTNKTFEFPKKTEDVASVLRRY